MFRFGCWNKSIRKDFGSNVKYLRNLLLSKPQQGWQSLLLLGQLPVGLLLPVNNIALAIEVSKWIMTNIILVLKWWLDLSHLGHGHCQQGYVSLSECGPQRVCPRCSQGSPQQLRLGGCQCGSEFLMILLDTLTSKAALLALVDRKHLIGSYISCLLPPGPKKILGLKIGGIQTRSTHITTVH